MRPFGENRILKKRQFVSDGVHLTLGNSIQYSSCLLPKKQKKKKKKLFDLELSRDKYTFPISVIVIGYHLAILIGCVSLVCITCF